ETPRKWGSFSDNSDPFIVEKASAPMARAEALVSRRFCPRDSRYEEALARQAHQPVEAQEKALGQSGQTRQVLEDLCILPGRFPRFAHLPHRDHVIHRAELPVDLADYSDIEQRLHLLLDGFENRIHFLVVTVFRAVVVKREP